MPKKPSDKGPSSKSAKGDGPLNVLLKIPRSKVEEWMPTAQALDVSIPAFLVDSANEMVAAARHLSGVIEKLGLEPKDALIALALAVTTLRKVAEDPTLDKSPSWGRAFADEMLDRYIRTSPQYEELQTKLVEAEAVRQVAPWLQLQALTVEHGGFLSKDGGSQGYEAGLRQREERLYEVATALNKRGEIRLEPGGKFSPSEILEKVLPVLTSPPNDRLRRFFNYYVMDGLSGAEARKRADAEAAELPPSEKEPES